MRNSLQLVSIVMATYNRERYILESLQSIQNQTYTNWECLIIDDGGTDNTKKVIEPLLNSDSRFKFYKRKDKYKKGLSGSRNNGIDMTKGDYIIFFDDDDFVHPNNLSYCLKAIKQTPFDFCHYQKQSFSDKRPDIEEGNLIVKRQLSKRDIRLITDGTYPMASCTVLWRKECFESIRFNESLMYAEEWECYTKIISNGFEGVSLDNVLYYNRKHEISNTGQFWLNNPEQVNSQKKAIELVVSNLKKKELLSDKLFKYLLNLTISLRDLSLTKTITKIYKPKNKMKLFSCALRFYLFPLWAFYKNIFKN